MTRQATSAASPHATRRGEANRPAKRQDLILLEIEKLKRRVSSLEAVLEVVDELPWEEALDRGRAYFADNPDKPTTPDVLARILMTSVAQAADVCLQLEKEGLVAGE